MRRCRGSPSRAYCCNAAMSSFSGGAVTMHRVSVELQQHRQQRTYSVVNSVSARFINHVGTIE